MHFELVEVMWFIPRAVMKKIMANLRSLSKMSALDLMKLVTVEIASTNTKKWDNVTKKKWRQNQKLLLMLNPTL
jgi:hypothetical protein